jgi:hypothetical protein
MPSQTSFNIHRRRGGDKKKEKNNNNNNNLDSKQIRNQN